MIDHLEEKLAIESPSDDNDLNKTQRGDETNGDDLNGDQVGEPEEEEERVTARFDSIKITHSSH